MASDEARSWIFSPEFIQHKTPSRLDSISFNDELNERQKCASLIQEVAKRIELMQTVANTALCYMHRFYMYHSFKRFRFDLVAPVALFLAAKVEEQPRKLDHIIYAVHRILYREVPANPIAETRRVDFAEAYTALESVMLQTLGFAIRFDQPHLHIVSSAQKIRGSRDLAQTAWFIATHCLHMSMFFVQYPPEVIACLCIYLACKWANVEMPVSNDQLWIRVVDSDVTIGQLETMTEELLAIIERCPAKLKQRMASIRGSNCLPPEVAEKLGIQFDASVNGNASSSYADLSANAHHQRVDVDSSDGAQSNANATPNNNGDQLAFGEAQSTPTPALNRRVIGVDQYRKRYLDSTRSGGPPDVKPGWNGDVKSAGDSKSKGDASGSGLPQVTMKKPRTGSLLSEVLKHEPTGRERTTSGSVAERAPGHHDKQRSHGDAHSHHTGEQRGYNKHDVYRSSQHSAGRERTVSNSNTDHSSAHGERERDRERERERERDRTSDRQQRERHSSTSTNSGTKTHEAKVHESKAHDSKAHDVKGGDSRLHDLPTTVPKGAMIALRKVEDEMEEGEIDDDE